MRAFESKWVMATAMAILTLVAVLWACEVDDSEDAATDTSTPRDTSSPTDTSTTDTSTPRDTSTPTDTSTPGGPYFLIRLDDQTPSEGGEHPGADIDGVAAVGSGTGGRAYATTIEDVSAGAVNTDGAITGQPTEPVGCFVGEFASLGGTGGHITLGFEDGVQFDSGDTITVYEIGMSQCAPSGDDNVVIGVAVGASVDGAFTTIGTCNEGLCTLTIP